MTEIKNKKPTKKENFTNIKNILAELKYDEYVKVMEHELELLEKKNSGDRKPTETQIANEGIKTVIIALLTEKGRMTISEMQKANTELAPLSTSKISALIKQLITDGTVVRTEDKRKAYFSIA
jgi:predicted transcriptional regulator